MKKIALLFLALSSLTLAGVSTTNNQNLTNSSTETNATAGININVSATVTAHAPELVITDASGNAISEVNFNHTLTAGSVVGQGEQSLTANLRVKGSTLNEANYLTKLNSEFGSNSLTLANNLTSNLTATKNGFDSNGAVLNVISTLSGEAVVGDYAAQITTLTVTYNKSTN